jgi:putative methionine-R-sulfoxide reductase with GAF domain/ligand-binding sensor protein
MELFDIIEKEKWSRMQNGFSKSLGICIRTVDTEGKLFPAINAPSSFCLDMNSQANRTFKACHLQCISMLIDKIKKNKSDNYRICAFGGYIYGIPIEIENKGTLAYAIVGPLLLQKQKVMDEYRKIAKETKIPLDYLMDRLSSLRKFTFNGVDSIVELLHEVTCYIIELNYETKKLKEKFNMPRQLDNVVDEVYSSACFDEVLNVLLDVSLDTTKGNGGSIMLLDTDTDELAVKFWRGLKDEVIKHAKVKVGEGISGIVAENRKPLLIDSSIKDSMIKERLKRPYIKSSIVYPLEIKNRLFGVLNLNNTDKNRRFDSETLGLIGNLAHLTQVALGAFPRSVPS